MAEEVFKFLDEYHWRRRDNWILNVVFCSLFLLIVSALFSTQTFMSTRWGWKKAFFFIKTWNFYENVSLSESNQAELATVLCFWSGRLKVPSRRKFSLARDAEKKIQILVDEEQKSS